MKKIIITFLLCATAWAQATTFPDGEAQSCPTESSPSAAQATSFSGGDAQIGEELFDRYKCNSCHIDKVGGDGSAIFTRPNRTVTNPKEMIEQMTRCSGSLGKALTTQEQQHLGAYLNQRYYKFK